MKLAVVAGAISADNLAFAALEKLQQDLRDTDESELRLQGVGGAGLQQLGLQSWTDIERLSVMGFLAPLVRLPELLWLRHRLSRHWRLHDRPDIFLGVDTSSFNLQLQHQLRASGIKTMQLVSPTVWSGLRPKRIELIKTSIDSMLCVYPFEAEIYKRHQMPHEVVGHPLADSLPLTQTSAERREDKQKLASVLGLDDTDTEIIALLPGSREQEVAVNLPIMLQTAQRMAQIRANAQFVIPAPCQYRYQQIKAQLKSLPLAIHLIEKQASLVLQGADAGLIVSGTACLEAMLYKLPHIAIYQLDKQWSIAASKMSIPYFTIPNLLAQSEIVREHIARQLDVAQITDELLALLESGNENMLEAFGVQHSKIRLNFADRVSKAILNLASS